MPILALNQAQIKSLAKLLDLLCADEKDTDVLSTHVCRFRDFLIQRIVSADMIREKTGAAYQLIITIPLGSKVSGFIRIYSWHSASPEFSVSINSSDSYDFAIHRHAKGQAAASLHRFFQEMDTAIAA